MKKTISALLALILLLSLTACGESTPSVQTSDPVSSQTEVTAQEEPTPPPYAVFEYEYGNISIAVPNALPEKPKDEGNAVLFSDPEGEWTVRFTPLSVSETSGTIDSFTGRVGNIMDYDYYKDVEIADVTIGGFPAAQFTLSRNPDWSVAAQGDTLFYKESHQVTVVNYGETFVGPWGGLMIDVSAPEDSTAQISDILADPDVQILLGHLEFHAGGDTQTISVPGLSVDFPARWTNAGSDGKLTLWASINGDVKGTIYFGSSIYADPEEAVGYIGSDSRSLECGGRTYIGAVRSSELSETVLETLELYTPFTDNHALQVKLSINGAEAEYLWDYAESDVFTDILASVQLDPAAYQEPEADRRNADGYTCNTIGELDGYTGTEVDLELPSVIGSNEIVGINGNTFKGNTTLHSVVIPEGVLYVEANAFQNCTALERVTLPNSLQYIDFNAFAGCSKLHDVTFGETLMGIDGFAFEDCVSLGDVNLPDSMIALGSGAFSGAGDGTGVFSCPADGVYFFQSALASAHFKRVEIGPNADLAEYGIMADAVVESVSIGAGCEELGELFLIAPVGHEDDPLSVELNGVKKIGRSAFHNRKGLTAIDLTGAEELGEDCLEGTGLTAITVPGTVKEIPAWAFADCEDLMAVTLEEGVEVIHANAFNDSGRIHRDQWYRTLLTEEEDASMGARAIPNGDPEWDRALTVTLPSTLKTVEEYAFNAVFIDGLWMEWCTSPDQLPDFDENAFVGGFVAQAYFTEETINACGDQLDAYLMTLTDVGDVAWYFEGKTLYWSTEPLM